MNMKYFVLAVALMIASSVRAQFGNDAMFGLTWGMSPKEVQSRGVVLTKKSSDGTIEVYSAKSLPKNISDVDFYTLVFANGRLVKLSAAGETITNDQLGSEGKERYQTLKQTLTEKYGKPSDSSEIFGVKLYKDSDEFYQCLRYSGCGMWASLYKTSDRVISVELKGLGPGRGYISVVAESVPEFSQALDAKEQSDKRSDADAL